MKKLLVFSMVFVLLATAAFAQAEFGAGGGAKATLMSGDSSDKGDTDALDTIGTGFESWFWVGAGKTNEEGTMGAKGSISINTTVSSLNASGDDTWFYAWWRPIEQVFLKFGKIGEDGKYWAGAGILGWDFQSNDLLMSPAFNYYNGFAGSLIGDSHGYFADTMGNYKGLQFSLLPIDGLAINLGWEIDGNFKQVFIEGLNAQLVYDISGAGTAAVGFVNGGEDDYKQLAVQYHHPLGAMKIELGASFMIAPKDADNAPLDIGIGFGYGSPWGDTFWLNARVGLSIAMEDYQPTIIGFDVCPSYDIGMFRFYAPISIAMLMPNEGDSLFAWSLNPYIRKQVGGIEFWAGLKLYNGTIIDPIGGPWYPQVADKDSQKVVNWAVPIGILWAW